MNLHGIIENEAIDVNDIAVEISSIRCGISQEHKIEITFPDGTYLAIELNGMELAHLKNILSL